MSKEQMKQELLTKSQFSRNVDGDKSVVLLSEAIEIVERNRKEVLPVVPKYVSDWFEEVTDLEDDLFELIGEAYTNKDSNKLEKFMLRTDIDPIQTIIKMKDGYTILQPKRVLKVGKMYFVNSYPKDDEQEMKLTDNIAVAFDFINHEAMDSITELVGGEFEEVYL